MTNQKEKLPYLSSEERLEAYRLITDGCHHVWSKNKLQEERAQKVLEALVPLAFNDPYFLAHLTSWVIKKNKSKDMQVFTSYVATLSQADGSPFSPGSKYKKPNLRYVGNAAVHKLDPKLALRVAEVANRKYAVRNYFNNASHFPTTLRTALRKYILYREENPEIMRGIKKAGLANVVQSLYRATRMSPSDEAASILRWEQKDRDIEFESSISFDELEDLEIAEKIRDEKLGLFEITGALGAANKKITPVIAVALLEQVTGNQAVILRSTFEDSGVLKDKEVMKLYKKKISEAKTAIDRVENIAKEASDEVAKVLKEERSKKRKEATAGIGKIFLHLDFSGSMDHILKFAVEKGAIMAEAVDNPEENFAWGLFGTHGENLPLPDEFVSDAFAAVLFGKTTMGSTDAFALYPEAREFGADVDVFVTDQGHNMGDLEGKIRQYHQQSDHPKPKAAVIVQFRDNWGSSSTMVQNAYEENDIPVAIIEPDTLSESALVGEAIKTAMVGPVATIDEIMETELLKLPEYYYTI